MGDADVTLPRPESETLATRHFSLALQNKGDRHAFSEQTRLRGECTEMPDAETGTQWGLSIDQPQDRQACAQVPGIRL